MDGPSVATYGAPCADTENEHMTPEEIRRDKESRLRAVAEARGHFETLVRLAELENEHRTLTPRQEDDRDEARARYNRLAAGLGLPEIRAGADWSTEDWQTVKAQLYGTERRWQAEIEKDDRSRQLVRSMPSWMVDGSLYDRNSGLPPGRHADTLRDMIRSGERVAEFDLVGAHDTIRADETRAIADFSDGGKLYTSDFSTLFAMYQRTESPWFAVASIVRADNGRPLVVPGLTGDLTSYSPGEGTAITESTPTLGSATVTPVSYKALSYVSMEAVEDAEYPLAQRIAESAARSISLQFGSAATSTILAGIANGGTASGLGGGGTATFVGYEDLLDLEYGRAAPYRQAGSWVMSNGMILKARKFTDKNGEYLWQRAVAAGQPDTFDGRAVYEDPYLVAPASATKSALFGDWSRALVIKASSLRVEVSTDYRFNQDQVSFKTVLRAGLAVVDSAAAAYLVSANT